MEQNNFDEGKVKALFTDEKLSPNEKLIKYGFVSGWLLGLFANPKVYEKFKAEGGGKNFQDVYLSILEKDYAEFKEKTFKGEEL